MNPLPAKPNTPATSPASADAPCPECNGTRTMDYGMADSAGCALREWCDTCRRAGRKP